MNSYKIYLKIVSLICLIVSLFIIGYIFTFFNKPNEQISVNAYAPNISEVQRRLKNWGYYNGQITGALDWETQEAIKYFQRKNGLQQTGKLDYATANAIGISLNSQNNNDLYLLAKCIYAEARGEIYVGKVAVGAVILNRVKSSEFPNSIYGVIYQPWAFTSVHDGQINLEPNTECIQAAQDALNGWDPSYGSLFYYNPAIATSSWIFNRKVVVQIGKHVFAV